MIIPPLLFYGPSIIGMVVISILIVANNSGDRASKVFAAPMVVIALWLALQFWAQSSSSAAGALVLIRAVAVVAAAMALVYYFVMMTYLRRKIHPAISIVIVAIGVALSLLTMFGNVITVATANASGISLEEVSPLYYVILLYTLLIFTVALVSLFRATRRLPRVERARNYILFYSSLQMLVISGFGTVVLSGVAAAQILIVVSALIFCIGLFFGIIRHQLFDVRTIAVRTLGYVLSLMTLAVVYLLIAYVLSRLFFRNSFTTNVSFSPINVGLALLLAFIFQPVKTFFDHITNRIFYRDHYSAEEFYGLLSNVLSGTTDLKSLLQQASGVIATTFKGGQAFFYVRYDGHHLSAGTPGHSTLLVHEAKRLDSFIAIQNESIIVVQSINRRREVYAMLARKRIEVLLPLRHDGHIMGYFALGDALGTRYTTRDIRVLETIADELVIAIQNALSLEEVREVNATLQTRIDTATHSLRVSNDKLRRLDDTKDEFISMASHQLRTPLTSVKGYVSMMLDGDAGPINDQQRKFLTEAFESSNRMAGIIGDFLNVSRLQTGKFTLERENIALGSLIESEVDHLETTAAARGLKLKFHKPARFPEMQLDKSKIQQVVMNFIDNAIFYAPDTGSVDIELFQRSGKAIFTVRDHGIGVPKPEQANLFTKFFRATNARRKRPDGTGVGLFLAKKVIVAHGGTIIFDSKEGQGSTFGFEIPLA